MTGGLAAGGDCAAAEAVRVVSGPRIAVGAHRRSSRLGYAAYYPNQPLEGDRMSAPQAAPAGGGGAIVGPPPVCIARY